MAFLPQNDPKFGREKFLNPKILEFLKKKFFSKKSILGLNESFWSVFFWKNIFRTYDVIAWRHSDAKCRKCVSSSFGVKRIFQKAILHPFPVICRKSVLHRIFSYWSEVFRTVFKIPKFQPQAEKSKFSCDFLNFFIEFRSRFDHLDCVRVQYCSPYHQSSCQMKWTYCLKGVHPYLGLFMTLFG